MKSFSLKIAATSVLALAAVSQAQLTPQSPYTFTPVYSDTSTFGSFTPDGSLLYVGRNGDRTVVSVNPSTHASTPIGSVGTPFTDFSSIFRSGTTTYAAYGTSFSPPFPYKVGFFDNGGAFNLRPVDAINGAFDTARNSLGEIYLSAAPTANNSVVLRYNPADGTTKTIATLGGTSGGVAFDSLNNLYYSSQTGAGILKFTAAEIAAAGLPAGTPLTPADGDQVVNVTASFLAINPSGAIFATPGFGSSLNVYNPSTGALATTIATASGATNISQIRFIGDQLYANVSDFSTGAGTIYSIVPEPTGLTILFVTAIGTLTARRRR